MDGPKCSISSSPTSLFHSAWVLLVIHISREKEGIRITLIPNATKVKAISLLCT